MPAAAGGEEYAMLLIQVLNMSLTASYCILAVLLARLLLRRAPKKYAYLLWLVVAFRLCCPVSLTSPLSLFGLGIFDREVAEGHTMAYLDEDVGLQKNPQLNTGLAVPSWQSAVGDRENGHVDSWGEHMAASSVHIPLPAPGDGGNSVNPLQVWGAVGILLWLSGMGVMLLCGLVSYLLLRRRLRRCVLLQDNIYQSELVTSPFILGFWRPRIYIPFGLEECTQELVLAHERYHLRRRDYWVKLAAYLLLSLHWFNPLCWVAFLLMVRDMEMSCDEHVLAEKQHSRKPYCNALLDFAADRRSLSPSPLAFGESGAKERIHNALNWKKPGSWVKAAAVTLCLVTLAACALNPQAESPEPEQVTPDRETAMPDSAAGSNSQPETAVQDAPGEWIRLRTSGGGDSSAAWDADALRAAREGLTLLGTADMNFYGTEYARLEVSWECEELALHVEYYEESDAGPVLTEQRDLPLTKENGSFLFYLANPYDKLQGNGQEVHISFSHEGADYLIRGFIPAQSREQKEPDPLEPGDVAHFEGLIRSISDDSVIIDQKQWISSDSPEWENWVEQWEPDGGVGYALQDMMYKDIHAPVSEDCRIFILENHWYPEREISWEELPGYVEETPWHLLWYFTVEGDRITEIREQYLP